MLEKEKVSVTKETAKIGLKVVRGKDWAWHNQDHHEGKESIGKIIQEANDDGWVSVQWAHGRDISYRVGHRGQYDLYVYEEEKSSDNFDKESVTTSNVKLGLKVVRGKDWEYNFQDYNDEGKNSVGEIIDLAGYGDRKWIEVKWENGYINNYRIGYKDKFDLYIYKGDLSLENPFQFIDHISLLPPTQKENKQINKMITAVDRETMVSLAEGFTEEDLSNFRKKSWNTVEQIYEELTLRLHPNVIGKFTARVKNYFPISDYPDLYSNIVFAG
jgi:hypothetical protein